MLTHPKVESQGKTTSIKPTSEEKKGEAKINIQELERVQPYTSEKLQIPIIDEVFPEALNKTIMQYLGVETLQAHRNVDTTKDKKFDGMYHVKLYQKKISPILSDLWKNEVDDLQKIFGEKDSKLELTLQKGTLEFEVNKNTYQALLKKYNKELLYNTILNFILGKHDAEINFIRKCIVHYCRFPKNQSEKLLTQTIFELGKTDINQETADRLNKLIGTLLDMGAATSAPRSTDQFTPLMAAATVNLPQVVESLLESNISLRHKDYFLSIKSLFDPFPKHWKWSPLLQACCFSSINTIAIFLRTFPQEMLEAQRTFKEGLEYCNGKFNGFMDPVITVETKDSTDIFSKQPVILYTFPLGSIKYALYKLLRAASNINNQCKKQVFEYKYQGEYKEIVNLGIEVELNQASDIFTLKLLYNEIIYSNLLDPPSQMLHLIFEKDQTLKMNFIAQWREKAFQLLEASVGKISTLAYRNECRDLLYHDAFSHNHEKGKQGVAPDYRERLGAIHESIQVKAI